MPAAGEDRTSRQATRVQLRRAAGLAAATGCVDAYGLIRFGVFTSFMSGNTTSTGLRAGELRLGAAAHHLLPIPSFVIAAFLATFLFANRRERLRPLCVISAALLVLAGVGGRLLPHDHGLGVIVLSLAMGMVSSVVGHVGQQRLNVGFVTGDLIKLGTHLALAARRAPVPDACAAWDTHLWRAAVLARVWAALLVGALFAGIATDRIGELVLAAPIAIFAAVALAGEPRLPAGPS